ncbi:twin-arginine translocase subunit TatC [Flavobacterium croceum]|uniref:twin-arginine translocase subunit TatC n=1 Tax=Flavobacterium croceum TaxID=370975 RepID=UPI0024A7ACA5|nr:twin-arginine translocase subunit TatC [Flavobacterium croceum]
MTQKEYKDMSFLDHLNDLRWVLVKSSIAIVIMAFVAYFFSDFIFDTLIFGPTRTDFVTYRFFCEASHYVGFKDSICIEDLPFTIQNTEMEGQVNIFIWTLILAGFILAFPYVLYQFWTFISPALYEKERKNAKLFIGVSSFLFFIGILFGYFVIIPMSVNFLATFKISDVVKNDINIDSYIGMIKTSVIASGLFFELPIIMYFLSKLGLVNPTFLRKYRRHAIVGVLIIAAIVTPPDVVSQVIVTIPMLMVYELSIFISAYVTKKQEHNG